MLRLESHKGMLDYPDLMKVDQQKYLDGGAKKDSVGLSCRERRLMAMSVLARGLQAF